MSPRVAIVGAGPAGLSSAGVLEARGFDCVLFEAGLPASRRDHRLARDIGIGVGGAGVFSDGKFSYFPSATHLYDLERREYLVEAYEKAIHVLGECGIAVEPFPYGEVHRTGDALDADGQKRYACHHATLSQRRRLISRLARDTRIYTGTTIVAAEKAQDRYVLVTADRVRQGPYDAVVIATGKIGLAGLNTDLLPASVARPGGRVEVGIRIDAPSDVAFFHDSAAADIKFIWTTSNGAEARTFCTCRNGEVWLVEYPSFSALSGRSDCPRTGFSNFGLLVRSAQLDRRRALVNIVAIVGATKGEAFWEPLPNVLAGSNVTGRSTSWRDRPWYPSDRIHQRPFLGMLDEATRTALVEALARLVTMWPDFLDSATACIFPAIEGLGHYPALDGDLRVVDEGIWFAGDAAGRFRGIVAGLVSGYYVGNLVADTLQDRM